MNYYLSLAALVPAVILFVRIYQLDRIEKEPHRLLGTLILCGALSASLWYEGFLDYLRECAPAPGARVYLSLGKKEEKVRSPRYARVGDGVRQAHSLLAERLGAENVRLQWFDGGHGTEPARRMLEGLKWLLARP